MKLPRMRTHPPSSIPTSTQPQTAQNIPFTKMHALENDFILLENPPSLTADQIRHMAHRRHGIGCDQVLILTHLQNDPPHARLTIWNQDGTLAEACGNGTRCVVAYLARKYGLTTPVIETAIGNLRGWVHNPEEIEVEQGIPQFHAPLDLSDHGFAEGFPVTLGNPHLVIFVPHLDAVDVEKWAPLLEHHPFFPQRTNVEFVDRQKDTLRVRVWERGAGLTPACGSGACAVAALAIHQKKTTSPCRVQLDGGILTVTWTPGQTLTQRGSTSRVFEGITWI